MIVYYGQYSNTAGDEYLIGYEEGNSDTGNVIIKKMENNKNKDEFFYQPIKIGEKEKKETKKVWDIWFPIKE